VNVVDIIIVVAIVASAAHGFFRGAAIQLCSFAGFWGGLLLGALLSPHITKHISNSLDRTVVAVVIVFGLAIILGGIGERVGSKVRSSLRVMFLGPLDSGVGAAIGVVATLLAIWLIAAMLLAVGNVPAISHPIGQSAIVKELEKKLPPAPSVFARVGAVLANTGLPQAFANITPTSPVPLPTPASPAVAAAEQAGAASTVKVEGFGCGGIKSGSGFVVAPGVVVTNAHVVSGIELPEVYDTKGRHADVTVVLFDPEVDLAVLRVSGLSDKPLHLDVADAPRGTTGAVLGYPGGGPFTYVPAIELESLDATGRDIYGHNITVRSVYELQADVRPGNSGGPFMSSNGQVIGVVFSASVTFPNVGYALSGKEIAPDVNKALNLTAAVNTQTCSG
jgi:S1-C subfamily serine protease